ncbi:bacteriohemerythrin [Rhodopseudomonas sp.]|uniref:bacteriohemerythrin n=1 Tax=Rhodopseudomonas sp. TaxID=1078 RepID=UPI0039E6D6FF
MMLSWNSSCVIDNGIIDADHRAIIESINCIHKLLNVDGEIVSLRSAVDELRALAVAHFGREEHLHELLSLPNRLPHHAEHRELIREVDNVIAELASPSVVLTSPSCFRLRGFFHRWILGHILTSDLEMQRYFPGASCPTMECGS